MSSQITLFDDAADANSPPRIWLNDGSVPAAGAGLGGLPYEATAFVPRETWRLPTPEEAARLFRKTAPREHGTCLSIVGLPRNLRERIAEVDLSGLASIHEFVAFVQGPAYLALQAELVEFMLQFRRSGESYLLHSPVFSAPGLPTVTVGPTGRDYLGLHLDSWYSLDLATRDGAPNRISVNLGREDREFLFLEATMTEIVKRVPPASRVLGDVVKAFLAENPGFPVIKVRVAPGEAYIAPTENLIHDGRSLGKRFPDVHLTARGFFGFPPQA